MPVAPNQRRDEQQRLEGQTGGMSTTNNRELVINAYPGWLLQHDLGVTGNELNELVADETIGLTTANRRE